MAQDEVTKGDALYSDLEQLESTRIAIAEAIASGRGRLVDAVANNVFRN